MGASGAGKTRLLDCLTNYMQGVQRNDPFRYQLVCEGTTDENKANSQTQNTTFYCIESQINVPPIVVIDTRGFADTRGTAEDEKTDAQLGNLFQNHTDRVDLVCFVIKSNENRLADREKYVFANVLKFFSKSTATHFRFLMTFKDTDDTPEVINILKAPGSIVAPTIASLEKAAIEWCFYFNNSAVYKKVEDTSSGREFWKAYQDNMAKFVKMVHSGTPMDLAGTRQTIQKRAELNTLLSKLRVKSGEATTAGTNIQEAIMAVSESHLDLEQKGQEIVESNQMVMTKIPVQPGKYTTYCTKCAVTCHEVCVYGPGCSKQECVAMAESFCTKCISKCHHELHINTDIIVVMSQKKVFRTRKEIRDAQFTTAELVKLNKENVVDELLKKYDRTMAEYLRIQEEILNATNELSKLALAPTCYDSMSGYLEMQLRNERNNKEPGYEKRIEFIEEAWLRNEFAMNAIKKGEALPNSSIHEVIKSLLDEGKYSNRGVLEQWVKKNPIKYGTITK